MNDTFIADQLAAATDETTVRFATSAVANQDRADWLDRHPAETALIQSLAAALPALTLCPHHSRGAPAPSIWAPGMTVLGCHLDYLAHRESLTEYRCNTCSSEVPTNEGTLMTNIANVIAISTVCTDCREAPASDTDDDTIDDLVPTLVADLKRLWSAA